MTYHKPITIVFFLTLIALQLSVFGLSCTEWGGGTPQGYIQNGDEMCLAKCVDGNIVYHSCVTIQDCPTGHIFDSNKNMCISLGTATIIPAVNEDNKNTNETNDYGVVFTVILIIIGMFVFQKNSARRKKTDNFSKSSFKGGEDKPRGKFCSECGVPINKDINFCSTCGKKV